MTVEPIWLGADFARALYDRFMTMHGGRAGSPRDDLLEAALARPRHRFQYGTSDPFDLAAAYAFAIARDHPFPDGNKRISLTFAGVFLRLNGWRFKGTEAEAVTMTLALAAGELDEAAFAGWLRSNSTAEAFRELQ